MTDKCTNPEKPHPWSLVGLIAWCKARGDFRHEVIASYLETYQRITNTTYEDTMKRAMRENVVMEQRRKARRGKR